MFEWAEKAERSVQLARLVGVHEHLWLEVGDAPRVHATFDPMGLDPDKVSAVHYVRFRLPAAAAAALAVEGTVVRVGLDHPAYTKTAVLSEQTRAALAGDVG